MLIFYEEKLYWRNVKPPSRKEGVDLVGVLLHMLKRPRSPLSVKKMCHLCHPLMKKQTGSPLNERLKIHTLQ